jgi:restriction endonuclease S subunit
MMKPSHLNGFRVDDAQDDLATGQLEEDPSDLRAFIRSLFVAVEVKGGVDSIRRTTLELAVRGRLVRQQEDEGAAPASDQGRQIMSQEPPYKLPKSWHWWPLEAVFDPISTQGKKILTSKIKKTGRYPVVDQGQVLVRGYTDDEDSVVRPPRAVVLFGDHTRQVKFIDFVFVAGADGTKILLPRSIVDPRYFYWTLKSYRIESRGYGRHYNLLVRSWFPLPPLAEQRRIVAKIDQLMSLCDELEAKQAKKREVGDRLTKAALGALTSAEGPEEFWVAWRRVKENFEELIDRPAQVDELRDAVTALALSGYFSAGIPVSKGMPVGWRRTTLGELATLVTSGSRSWKNYYAPSGAIFIRSQDIRNDFLDLQSPAFVDPPRESEGTRTKVQIGDLLITITGANVGKAARVCSELEEAYVSQHVALIRLREPNLGEWLHHWLVCSHKGRHQLLGTSYGDKPGLNLSNVKSVIVDVPPSGEQRRILVQLKKLMTLCKELEAKLRAREEKAAKLAEALVAEVVG